jgi:hypothetical protein
MTNGGRRITTNAIVWELLPPRTAEEREFVVGYFRQLHFLQGLDDILISRDLFNSITNEIQPGDDYIKVLPEATKNEETLCYNFEDNLNSMLWKLKRTDIPESGLSCLLSMVEIWLRARELESVIVMPMSEVINSFTTLVHFLAGEKRDYLSYLADDVELWLFSHFADFYSDWPYFLRFTVPIAATLEEDCNFQQYKEKLMEVRNRCFFAADDRSILNYEKLTSKTMIYQKQVNEFLLRNWGENIMIARGSLALSKSNLRTLINRKWKYGIFETLESENKPLNPYFLLFRFYPFELLKSIGPTDLSPEKPSFLKAYHYFETYYEAELKFALEKYGRRFGFNTS